MPLLSQHNRNVRSLDTVETSCVMMLSLFLFERPAPGVILGWTSAASGAIAFLAVGRVGLCGSATRAPAGRLYASPAPSSGGRVFLRFPAGVGRRCAKLRGSGGRALIVPQNFVQ